MVQSGKVLTGPLSLLDPEYVPIPDSSAVYSFLFAGMREKLHLSLFFKDSTRIVQAQYVFKPVGSNRDSALALPFSDSVFSSSIDCQNLPFGTIGYFRTLDNKGNFYRLAANHLPSAIQTWSFRPNRWYAIKPTRNSRRLIQALTDRPALYEDMGQKYLYCYYRNGFFHDFSETDDFSALKITDAFLVFVTEPFSFTDTLSSILMDSLYERPISHALEPGWNLVVSPYSCPVSVSNIHATGAISPFFSISDSSNDKATYYYQHSPAIDSTDVLMPFTGYWVKASGSNNILSFHPYEAPVSGLFKKQADSWLVVSRVEPWALSVRNSRAGIMLGQGRNEMKITLPPGGKSCKLYSDSGLSVNIEAANQKGFVSRINLDSDLDHSFVLRSKVDEEAMIYIADDGRLISIQPDSTFTLPRADYSGIYFITGPKDFITKKVSEINSLYPDKFIASENYPNPFNPVTHIRYGVPFSLKGMSLSFIVYDIRGQIVFSRILPVVPGFNTLAWDAKDIGGKAIGSGFFIARLSIGNNKKTIKMVVLK